MREEEECSMEIAFPQEDCETKKGKAKEIYDSRADLDVSIISLEKGREERY
jgi:hypothetical protein